MQRKKERKKEKKDENFAVYSHFQKKNIVFQNKQKISLDRYFFELDELSSVRNESSSKR